MNKIVLMILCIICFTSQVYADSWNLPEPTGYASPDGNYVLRIIPGDFKKEIKSKAIVYEFSLQNNEYKKKREFFLINNWAPVAACISNSGEVYTLDDWGRKGYEHVVVWYSAYGVLLADYTLERIFPAKYLSEIISKHSSVSSIHWRKGLPFMNGPHLIIYDALGGSISVTNGDIEFVPKEN